MCVFWGVVVLRLLVGVFLLLLFWFLFVFFLGGVFPFIILSFVIHPPLSLTPIFSYTRLCELISQHLKNSYSFVYIQQGVAQL